MGLAEKVGTLVPPLLAFPLPALARLRQMTYGISLEQLFLLLLTIMNQSQDDRREQTRKNLGSWVLEVGG